MIGTVKMAALILAAFFMISDPALSLQADNSEKKSKRDAGSEKDAKRPPAPVISEEEREILKNRELLEFLELLQNFEKIKYLNFLSEPGKEKADTRPASKSPAKKNEKIEKKPKS